MDKKILNSFFLEDEDWQEDLPEEEVGDEALEAEEETEEEEEETEN